MRVGITCLHSYMYNGSHTTDNQTQDPGLAILQKRVGLRQKSMPDSCKQMTMTCIFTTVDNRPSLRGCC